MTRLLSVAGAGAVVTALAQLAVAVGLDVSPGVVEAFQGAVAAIGVAVTAVLTALAALRASQSHSET